MSGQRCEDKSLTEVSGRVTRIEGRGELPALQITTAWSEAEIYLHGAQVTHFKRHREPPLLFLSQCSQFMTGQPIRGGIPIIFPWFGRPHDKPNQHGFARITDWLLKDASLNSDGTVTVRLAMQACESQPERRSFAVDYVVTVGKSLALELIVTNSDSRELEFENCLHTYFAVGDIAGVEVRGLRGVEFMDQTNNCARNLETESAIAIRSEVDRAYLDTTHSVQIIDRALGRTIFVEKEGSASTVVWNPWIAKSRAMHDFGDDEYLRMICVESGNVGPNGITLPSGEISRLRVRLSNMGV